MFYFPPCPIPSWPTYEPNSNDREYAKTVKVTCTDGDILDGFVEFICDEERDVVFLLQSSSNPAKYKRGSNYAVRCDDIVDFQVLR